jgi:uncharacterized membrane protein (DUF4010 family)
MILSLAIIQEFGSAMVRYLGTGAGALVTGFFGGLVSSTATTASLARRSQMTGKSQDSGEMLIFLSATGAMLFEGLALVIMGTTDFHFSTILIFIGPLLATIAMIVVHYRKLKNHSRSTVVTTFQIWPLLKLSIFIVAILAVSQIFQNLFGQNGLLVLTSLVSLFEIHGSVIANVQLHESGVVNVHFLCSLLAVSVASSYLSKLFLIASLGSASLRSSAIKSTFVLLCSLILSWILILVDS